MRSASLRIATRWLLALAGLIGLWLIFYPRGYWIAGEYGLSLFATAFAAANIAGIAWLARRARGWWLGDLALGLVATGAFSALILASAPLWFNLVAPPNNPGEEWVSLPRIGFAYWVVFTFIEASIAALIAGWSLWLLSRLLERRAGKPTA